MTDPDSGQTETVDRRKVLAAMASTGAVSMAGCSGDGGSGGTTADTTTETDMNEGTPTTEETPTPVPTDVEPKDAEFNWAFKSSWNPVEANLNPESPNANNPWFINNIWGAMGIQANLRGQPVYMAAEDIEIADDNKSVTITYRDDYTWWDGTPLRAKDVTANAKVFNFQQYGQESAPQGEMEVVQEEPPVIRQNFECQQNPTLTMIQQRFDNTWPPFEWYKPWIDKYRDAGGESAINDITKDLGEETISMQDVVDNQYGASLWKPTDWNTQKVVHEKWEEHPFADRTNLEKFTIDLLGSNQKLTQAVANGRVDAGSVGQISGNSINNDAYETVHKVPTGASIGLRLNKANKHLDKPRVRRAMAYVLNHADIQTALESGLGVNSRYGGTQNMSAKQIENSFLPDDTLNSMIDYGKEAKTEKANELMKDAGYEKNGGIWTASDGSKVNLTHITPTWNKYAFISDYLSDKLENFGIKTDVQKLSYSGFQNKWQNTFEFDLATWFQQGLHPARWYGLDRNGKGYLELNGWGLSMLANPDAELGCEPQRREISEGKERDDRLNQIIRPEYPATVGTTDLNLDNVSDTKTLEPFVLNTRMRQATDKETLMSVCKEFAWYANWAVPNLELWDEVFTNFGKTEDFKYPARSQRYYHHRSPWLWVKQGRISGKAAE